MAKQLTLVELENTGDALHVVHDANNIPVPFGVGVKRQITLTSKIAQRYQHADDKGGPMKVRSFVPLDIDDELPAEGKRNPEAGKTVERQRPNLANPRGATKTTGGKTSKKKKPAPRVRLTKAEEREAEKRAKAEQKAEDKPKANQPKFEQAKGGTVKPKPGALNEGEPVTVTELLSRAGEYNYTDMLRIARALLPDDQLPDPRPSMPAIMRALRGNGNPQ